MRINSNIPALNAFNALNNINNAISKSIQQLSTGLRINSAADDAAGLAISEKLRTQTQALNTAIRNSEDGVSLLQTAEGALSQTHSILQRMRELSVQAANDTLTSQDRSYIQLEIDALKDQINNISSTTQFNKKKLLDGSVCGIWSSDELSTEAYIRGAIENDGNFRIEINSVPGMAQVQKSSIFKIRSENLVTDEQTDNSINNGVEISNIPAGTYQINAAKAGGGEVTYTYVSSVSSAVAQGNTSGVEKNITYYIYQNTATDDDNYSKNRYMISNRSITVPASATTAKDVAQLIVNDINNNYSSITRNGSEITLTAELDGDSGGYKITTVSNQNEIYANSIRVYDFASTTINQLTNTEDAQTYGAAIKAASVNSGNTSSYEEYVSITVSNETESQTLSNIATIPAGASETEIAALLKGINSEVSLSTGSGTDTITITGSEVANRPTRFNLEAKNSSQPLTVSLSISTANTADDAASVTTLSTYNFTSKSGYTTTYSGTVTAGNTSGNIERVFIYARNSSNYSNYIDVPIQSSSDDNAPDITTPEGVAKTIENHITNNLDSKLTIGGESISLETSSEGANFTIGAVGTEKRVEFYIDSISSNKYTTANFSTPEIDEDKTLVDTNATTKLTGSYNIDESAFTLGVKDADATTNDSGTQNNASILFEVIKTQYDEISGKGSVTLRASSNVLTSYGETASYSDNEIVLSSGKTSINIGALLGEDDDHLILNIDASQIEYLKSGSKFVYQVSGNGTSDKPVDTSLYVTGQQDEDWSKSWGGYAAADSQGVQYNLNSEAISNLRLNFNNFYLNSLNGKVYTGNIALRPTNNFAELAANFPEPDPDLTDDVPVYPITLSSFTANYAGKIATGDTQLKDIDRFYNSQGVFMLEQPQTITISQGDGKRTNITLSATDTLNSVKEKLNNAISDGLGQGKYVTDGDTNNFVSFVENSTLTNGMETVNGTFVLRSLIPGSDGELTFSSAYGDLIDAFGFNTIQNSKDTSYTASVYNAHDGTAIASGVNLSGNILKGVVDRNVDVKFDAMTGMKAVWSDTQKNYILQADSKPYITTIHLKSENSKIQTGANQHEDLYLEIGNMSANALGVHGVNVMTRDGAVKAIGDLDNAIKQVSAQRSKIGAAQNSLESIMRNVTTTSANLSSSESRIRDIDMAKTMLDFVKLQILSQSGNSVLAQANQLPQSMLSLIQ